MWFKETPRSPFVLGNRGVSKLYTVFAGGIIVIALGAFYWYATQLVVALLPERGSRRDAGFRFLRGRASLKHCLTGILN